MIIIIIITSFKSQGYLAEQECSTNWEDYKSTEIRTNQIKCWFLRRGEDFLEQSREPTNYIYNISGSVIFYSQSLSFTSSLQKLETIYKRHANLNCGKSMLTFLDYR